MSCKQEVREDITKAQDKLHTEIANMSMVVQLDSLQECQKDSRYKVQSEKWILTEEHR